MTPRKLFSNEYINSIISPVKDFGVKQIIGTPLPQNNYINNSPNNDLGFNSSMNSK